MRLGEGLLDAMRADLALQLDEIDHGAERAVVLPWQQRQRGRDVVRDHREPVGRVDREMDWVLSFRALPVDHGKLAGHWVDRHRRDIAKIAMHRVDEASRAVEGEKRRIDEIAEELD